jgi:hypothetical protein
MDEGQIRENVELELWFGLTTFCEINHAGCVSSKGTVPQCTRVAEAVLKRKCTGDLLLSCRPIGSWFEDLVGCELCGSKDCFVVEWV